MRRWVSSSRLLNSPSSKTPSDINAVAMKVALALQLGGDLGDVLALKASLCKFFLAGLS